MLCADRVSILMRAIQLLAGNKNEAFGTLLKRYHEIARAEGQLRGSALLLALKNHEQELSRAPVI